MKVLVINDVIKPCPWCGSKAEVDITDLEGPNGRGYPGCFDIKVKCTNCGATKPGGLFSTVYDDDEESAAKKAIDAWNTRWDGITTK